MDEINENIKVYIRQRPTNEGSGLVNENIADNSKRDHLKEGVQSIGANAQSCVYYSKTSNTEQKFAMDRFFGNEAQQEDLYETVALPIVESCLKGYSGLIMAYGPTGSGKTHTMRGKEDQHRGLMPRCIEQILSNRPSNSEVWASYLQIYCENISDLLQSETMNTWTANNVMDLNGTSGLMLRNKADKSEGVYVEGLTKYPINRLEDLWEILAKGDENRSIAATNMNETSSRSHAVLMVNIILPEDNDSNNGNGINNNQPTQPPATVKAFREGTLMLADLAGSERAIASEGRNYMRLEEAKAINLSLSALGNCMNALAENKPFVPYRDSKLTRLLQNCLGGTARTAIVVTIPPGEDSTGETLNALRFANRASRVKVTAKVSTKHQNYEALYKDLLAKYQNRGDSKQYSNSNEPGGKSTTTMQQLQQQLAEYEDLLREKEDKLEQQAIEMQKLKITINSLKINHPTATGSSHHHHGGGITTIITSSSSSVSRRPSHTTGNNSGASTPRALSPRNAAAAASGTGGGVAAIGGFFGEGADAAEQTSGQQSTMLLPASLLLNEESAAAGTIDNSTTAIGPPHLNIRQPNVVASTTGDHVLAVESMSRSLQQKTKEMKTKRLHQEVIDAERDLREERERHYRTVQELKILHEENKHHEEYFKTRMEELLSELQDRQAILDEQKAMLEKETTVNQRLEAEKLAYQVKISTQMVERQQVMEMEQLFQETIEKLSQRVMNLESQAQLHQLHQAETQARLEMAMEQAQRVKDKEAAALGKESGSGSGAGAALRRNSMNNMSKYANIGEGGGTVSNNSNSIGGVATGSSRASLGAGYSGHSSGSNNTNSSSHSNNSSTLNKSSSVSGFWNPPAIPTSSSSITTTTANAASFGIAGRGGGGGTEDNSSSSVSNSDQQLDDHCTGRLGPGGRILKPLASISNVNNSGIAGGMGGGGGGGDFISSHSVPVLPGLSVKRKDSTSTPPPRSDSNSRSNNRSRTPLTTMTSTATIATLTGSSSATTD